MPQIFPVLPLTLPIVSRKMDADNSASMLSYLLEDETS